MSQTSSLESVERQEAAEYLGVSLRTLDRLGAEGRISKGKALKKTRPVVVFDENELSKLKAEMTADASSNKVFRRLNTPPKDSVGFRLDPHYMSRLEAHGKASGQSPGECARTLVIRSLEDTKVEDFTKEVRNLREGLADTFYAFLTMKCDISEEEAAQFVAKTILRK